MNWSKYRKEAVFTNDFTNDFADALYYRMMNRTYDFDPDSRLNDLRAAYGYDPARPGHDKTVTSYYDPATGRYFQCDLDLDTFKKSEEFILVDDTKYFKFLQAFNVEDAQLV